jgi:hypothetical protein
VVAGEAEDVPDPDLPQSAQEVFTNGTFRCGTAT